MPSSYTSNLRLTLPNQGELSGTWGNTVNTGITTLVDNAVAGYSQVSVTAAAQALTTASGSTDQARSAMLQLTTTTGAPFAVYAPPVSKTYIVNNNSGFVATIYCSTVIGNTTAAGTGINIQNGTTVSVWTDGTNFYYTNTASAASGANSDITSLNVLASINSGYLYGNRVINGAQEIDQVNQGAAVTPASVGTPVYLTDMFGAFYAQNSKLTFQQVVDAPAGLKNSLKVTVASQYAPSATDNFQLVTVVEGKDVIDFQLGTAGAATITLSNWIKGSVAGTYSVALQNNASNRSYVGTVAVTTSWAQVKITLQGDLTGTWATDNTSGMRIFWDLGSGTNYNTTAGVWQAGNFFRTSGSVTFVNQVAGSTLNITGVDCRLGSVAPTYFERRADELQLAQRYYQLIVPADGWYRYFPSAGSYVLTTFPIPTMRTTPTVAIPSYTIAGVASNPVLFAVAGSIKITMTASSAGEGGLTTNNIITASARLF